MPLELDDVISSGNYKLTKSRLDSDKTIDILREDGILIKLAIRSGNAGVVKLVVEYFEQNQLSEYEERSHDAVILRNKMRSAIESANVYVTEEMQSILSKYIDLDPDDEQDAIKDTEVLAQDEEHHDGLSDEHITREGSGDNASHDSLTAATLVQGHNPATCHDAIEVWLAGNSTAVSEDL